MLPEFFRPMFCCFLLFAVCACGEQGETKGQKPNLALQEVQVAQVRLLEVSTDYEVMGTVAAVERATIAARVGGVIKDLPVELGKMVQSGDVLAEISADEIAARLNQSQTRMEQVRRNLDREKRLLEKDAATRSGVKDLEEALRMAESAYQEARTIAGYTTVTAPFDGLVAQKFVHEGDLASPGVPLLVLENNRMLQILADVPEGFVLLMDRGDKLPVFVPAADFAGTGTVAEIAPMADPLSRTAMVKISIEAQPNMRPGQFARVSLPGEPVDSSLFVPEAALLSFGQMEKVFVEKNGKAFLRLVRSGAHSDGFVEIVSGLNPGEVVVVANGGLLADGQPVRVIP